MHSHREQRWQMSEVTCLSAFLLCCLAVARAERRRAETSSRTRPPSAQRLARRSSSNSFPTAKKILSFRKFPRVFNPRRRDLITHTSLRTNDGTPHFTLARFFLTRQPSVLWTLSTTNTPRMGPLNSGADAATVGPAGSVVVERKRTCSGKRNEEREAAPPPLAPRQPSTVPSAVEWGDLVTTLTTLHLGQQPARACGRALRRRRPKVCTTLGAQETTSELRSCC